MIIIYAPEDGEERRWDLKATRIMATEAEAVERATGLEWEQAKGKVLNGSMLATRALAWVLMKRDQPDLRYASFAPAASELGYDLDAEEMAAIREGIENNPALDEEERAVALAELDAAGPGDEDAPAEPDEEAVPKDSAAEASPTGG